MHSAVLEFSFDGALVNATPNFCSGIVYQNSKLQLHSVVSDSSFKDVMLLPSRSTLLLWVSKWRQEGSVKDSKLQGRLFLTPAPDSVEQVRGAML